MHQILQLTFRMYFPLQALLHWFDLFGFIIQFPPPNLQSFFNFHHYFLFFRNFIVAEFLNLYKLINHDWTHFFKQIFLKNVQKLFYFLILLLFNFAIHFRNSSYPSKFIHFNLFFMIIIAILSVPFLFLNFNYFHFLILFRFIPFQIHFILTQLFLSLISFHLINWFQIGQDSLNELVFFLFLV